MVMMILSNLFILMMFTYLGCSIFPLRYKNMKINLLIFILFFLCVCTVNLYGASSHGLILLWILHSFYLFIMFKGNVTNYLLVLIPFPLLIIISEFFTANILNILIDISPKIDINSAWFFCAIILSNIITFLFLLIYIKISKLFIEVKLPAFTWMIFILPISSFILLFKINDINYYLLKKDYILFLSIIGVFISNFITLYIFYRVISSYEYKKELEKSNNREKLANLKYELMESHYNANFNFLHDILNKCNELNMYIVKEEYDKALDSLSSLYNNSYKEFNAIYSNSVLLNYLIIERLEEMDKNNIDIRTVIEYNDFNFLSLDEQNKLFSTLLDYAIQSAKEANEPRTLIIKTCKKDYQIIIQVLVSSTGKNILNKHLETDLESIIKNHNALISEKYLDENAINSILIIFSHFAMKNIK